MKIVLHIGAHRTGTTTFQSYLRRHAARIDGLGFWGPRRTRAGLFAGILPSGLAAFRERSMRHTRGRLRLNLERSEERGVETLLISDENVIGTIRGNLKNLRLYRGAGQRMAHFDHAFEGRLSRVLVTIRSHEEWWRSASAYGIARGMDPLCRARAAYIARMQRGWQDVVTDLACALPKAEIVVVPFEDGQARPLPLLHAATGYEGPVDIDREWLNASPGPDELRHILSTRGADPSVVHRTKIWSPFTESERAALTELYQDDLFWFRKGADGLATFIETPGGYAPLEGGETLTGSENRRVGEKGRLARPG